MPKNKHLKNIYNINPNYNFLPSLADWVLEYYYNYTNLKNATILLPSRRACRQLRQIFLQNKSTAELPKIIAIGDVDYDDLDFLEEHQNTFTSSTIANQTLLISEIKNWNKKTHLFGKNISTASIAEIASHLQSFLDEVEKENLNLDDLKDVEGFDLASHRQQILQFLRHFGSNWQNILAKNNLISIAKYRNLAIESYRKNLEKFGSNYPIICAGSTGSVLATANLLKTISNLENGKLILFGLDKNLNENIWQEISEIHPQFMLKKLLDKMEIARSEVTEIILPQFKLTDDVINNFTTQIMLPADYTDIWRNADKIGSESLKNLKIISTKDEFSEAKIIADILKSTTQTKNKTAALISNDANLIDNVKARLSKWQIKIDDWKSNNLAACSLANYLFLISEFATNDFNSINLLAILKHPLTKLTMDKELLKKNLLVLETEILRGVVSFKSFENIIAVVENKDRNEHQEIATNPSLHNLSYTTLKEFLQKISIIFAPLQKEFLKVENDFKILLEAHFNCTKSLMDHHPDDAWDPQSNKEMEQFLEFYQNTQNQISHFHLEPSSYNHILKHFLKNYQFERDHNSHPHLQILSTMEARLMNYDLTVISGLIEGEFPSTNADDWLGNKIRADFGLPNLNKKIGISAYDFCNYLGGKEIILTYPQSKNNAPTLKSRFLLRMEAVMKINNIAIDETFGAEIAPQDIPYITSNYKRPQPKSPIPLAKISATDISKWLRDPYFVYAKRILQLKPLKEIGQEPSFAEFGNFIHKVFENFINDYSKIPENEKLEKLINHYGKKTFAIYFPNPESKLLWWPRFENIAKWFVKEEEKLRQSCKKVFTEIEAKTEINNVKITTKIDRINLYDDDTIEIIDYKTGILPTTKEVSSGLEPQLAVEAVILSLGQVRNYPILNQKINLKQVKELQYWQLKGRDQNEIKIYQAEELTRAAQEGLENLINIFTNQNHAYICCPNFDIYRENDYYHLARIEEWK